MSVATLLLVLSFLVSIAVMLVLVWSISTGKFSMGPDPSHVIFDKGEIGKPDDVFLGATGRSNLSRLEDLKTRLLIDAKAWRPVMYLLVSASFWLVLGSLLGLIVSLKFHWPDWLSQSEFLTFGRLRPLHLNIVAYGWASMSGMGVALWLAGRLLKTELQGSSWAVIGTSAWNAAMVLGSLALTLGWSDGTEWLEFPWQIDGLFALAGAMIGLPILITLSRRKVDHLYVSIWYLGAAFIWFPFLFVVANLPHTHFGVQHAIVNWWFAHNVLGLWLTPLGLGAAYYFIPKIIGKPIHSYKLSLLGFWAIALFYSQVGLHHLIGGPVPTWVTNLSIVTSMMMSVPVVAVAINHHMTMLGSFHKLKESPTLAFVVTGALFYTATSFQGSLQSLRSVNAVSHFTHATVAHAHLGVYGFVSFIMFGAIYYIMPRLTQEEWPMPRLITWHYRLALAGILIYFVFLTIGGVLQGFSLLNAKEVFKDSLLVTEPYLIARSVGGTLMTVAHLIFAYHLIVLLSRSWDFLSKSRETLKAIKDGKEIV